MLNNLFGTNKKSTKENDEKKAEQQTQQQQIDQESKNLTLREQIKEILETPDEKYNDKMLTSEMRRYIKEVEDEYAKNISDFKSHIAPSYRETKITDINISGLLGKCYYTQSYPTYIDALRTREILSMHAKRDMTFYIYPEDDSAIQSMLKRKATQLKAELNEAMQKGITSDKDLEQQYRDVEMIREKLSTREERYFEFSSYFNIYDQTEDTLKEQGKKFEQKIGGFGIRVKNAIHRMDEGLIASLPLCIDELGITRSSVTSSLAGSFPFISNDLVQNTGIFYGLNLHTGGLVIFDRFNSKLPNMNSVILATSGAGKSFTVKLEILRYLLNGIDAIVIDPENEYKQLCEAVGGTYVNIATNSQQYINPFDIPPKIEDVEYGKGDLLRSQIMSLVGLVQILIGSLSAEEEALLDKALQSTYALRGFSFDSDDYSGKQPPLMEDLMNVLNGMDGGEKI
jgi:type IV secretory pathway VirB4 component